MRGALRGVRHPGGGDRHRPTSRSSTRRRARRSRHARDRRAGRADASTPTGSAITPRATTTGPRTRSPLRWALEPLAIPGRRLDRAARGAAIDAEVEAALAEVVATARALAVICSHVRWATPCATALGDRRRVVLLGEDIVDPYGGAFKVTRGLSTDFPERVRTTPISEGAIAGISAGLALAGSGRSPRSCSATSSRSASTRSSTTSPSTRRCTTGRPPARSSSACPSGGGRGYGPTHSQSLEKHFLGVPAPAGRGRVARARPGVRCFARFLQQDARCSTSSTSCSTR